MKEGATRRAEAGRPGNRLLVRAALLALALGVVGWSAWLRGGPGGELAAGDTSGSGVASSGGETAADPAVFGEGFVVWESNRSDAWRLWRRELQGGEARLLTPPEDALAHCCAHISPDGARIAYLRFRPGQRRSSDRPPVAELWVMVADGGEQRRLDERARLPSESRSVVWLSERELLYVDADGHTRRLDLDSGETSLLTERPHELDGWLVNRPLEFATTAWVSFSPYDRATKTIAERRVLGGCQPYFSHDGRWGFWVAGAGGPINRIDLASREVSTILAKNDGRLPRGQGYLYFPMLSRDGGLLAFGASPNDHDFNTANYDIFVVATDPTSIEIESAPLRITEHPATDRFPDVFRLPLPLGRHRGEAPLAVSFRAPSGGTWTWHFGDGSPPREGSLQGPEVVRHVFEKPGVYGVLAQGETKEARGLVIVQPARPPRAVDVRLRGERRIEVIFDEEVELNRVEVELASGSEIVRAWSAPNERSLVVEVAEPLQRPDVLRLSGVVDRAHSTNAMPITELEVRPDDWPSDPEGLVLRWQTADAPNLVWDPQLGVDRTHVLGPRERARLDHHYRMRTGGGAFVAGEESAEWIAELVRQTNELTVELRLESSSAGNEGRRDILSFGAAQSKRQNFVLSEEGSRLVFRMRDERLELFELPRDRAVQVAVTYAPGRLRAYLEGELLLESDAVQGDFFHWRGRPLTFGSGPRGSRDWPGALEGIALYRRVLSPKEIRDNVTRYVRLVAERPEVTSRRLRATLVRRSATPSLEEIAPYRQALLVNEYETGPPHTGRWRVVHWAILDGEVLPITNLAENATVTLELERFSENPQLENLLLEDTLPPAPELDLYYDSAHP